MKHLFQFSAFMAIVVLLSSCTNDSPVTTKALEYGDNLKTAIDDFEESRQDFKEEVSESVSNTTSEMGKKNPDLPKVAEDWESQWNAIMKRYDQLEEDFSLVGKSSEDYFSKLQELSSSISNESIRNSELRKNKELKDKWTQNYVDASQKIGKIRGIIKEGKDFHLVLVASSIRQKIEEDIYELQRISVRAEELLKELEQFTIEGKKLVS